MAGLIVLLLLTAGLGATRQATTLEGRRLAEAARRLEALLQAPDPSGMLWRRELFWALQQLEHAPVGEVRAGWEALAATGGDGDRANLLLYLRRHALPLPEPEAEEGAESTLERCLAEWGEQRLSAARRGFQEAVARFPQDQRLLENLLWLDLKAPESVPRAAGPRLTALAVLAARMAPD